MKQMTKECIWAAASGSVPGDTAVRKHKKTQAKHTRDDITHLEEKKIYLKPKLLVMNWTVQDMTQRTVDYHMKEVKG
jgi:hypothetical protein